MAHTMTDRGPRRILVIDDNPDILKDFQGILGDKQDTTRIESLEHELFGLPTDLETKQLSYDLAFADQGEGGVKMIKEALNKESPFQLAFVDMRMPPGWNGLKTISEIWKIDTRMQIVLCTAYSDSSWYEINRELDYPHNLLILKKPYDITEVAQLASALTDKWFLARQAGKTMQHLEALVEERTRTIEAQNRELKNANNCLENEIAERIKIQDEKEALIKELQQALENVKTLTGLLPICSLCKKVRDDKGYWEAIENYISLRSEAEFSHSLCPACAQKLYGNEPWFQHSKLNKKNK